MMKKCMTELVALLVSDRFIISCGASKILFHKKAKHNRK